MASISIKNKANLALPAERERGLISYFEGPLECGTDYYQNDAQLYNISEVSVVASATLDFTPGSGGPYTICDASPASATGRIQLVVQSDGKLSAVFGSSASSTADASWTSNLVSGVNSFAFTHNGSRCKVYCNGTEVLDSASPTSGTTESTLIVGATSGGIRLWEGLINSMRVFGKALSEAEIASYVNGTPFSYANQAELVLPMTKERRDDLYSEITDTLVPPSVSNDVSNWSLGASGTATQQTDAYGNKYVRFTSGPPSVSASLTHAGPGSGKGIVLKGEARTSGASGLIGHGNSFASTSDTDWQRFELYYAPGMAGTLTRAVISTGYIEIRNLTVYEVDPAEPELGDDILPHPGFDDANALSDWSDYSAPSTKELISDGSGGFYLRVGDPSGYGGVVRNAGLALGGYYRITGKARNLDSSNALVGVNGALGNAFWTASTSWVEFDFIVGMNNAPSVYLTNSAGGGNVEFDDISIKPIKAATLGVDGTRALLGNGFDRDNMPIKLDTRGYVFSGDNYMKIDVSDGQLDGTGDRTFTVACRFADWNTFGGQYIVDSEPDRIIALVYADGRLEGSIGGSSGQVAVSNWTPYGGPGSLAVITVRRKSGVVSLWLNGVKLRETTRTDSALDIDTIYLGAPASNPALYNLEGDIYYFSVTKEALREIQIKDLRDKLQRSINEE